MDKVCPLRDSAGELCKSMLVGAVNYSACLTSWINALVFQTEINNCTQA